MPVYRWIANTPTSSTTGTTTVPPWVWYNGGTAAQTTSTISDWVTLSSSGTTAATTIMSPRAAFVSLATRWRSDSYDDWSNDNTYTSVRMSPIPQRNRPTAERIYLATRDRARAVENDLRHYYEMEQRNQAANIRQHHAQAAQDRARELLLSHLTPAQRETFEKHKWFIVEGGLSKQRYRIRDTGHMVANIDVLDVPKIFGRDDHPDAIREAKVTHRLCGHCDIHAVPLYDQLLAQKMMLEFDEERFLKLANRHRVVA